ncbi:hypothetical protein G210_0587 [Candida maltosa Xu316]|uniref:Uncharacterized protein n=1 Tax=Candida maltosa (strain Xu316) TaxID=1245528 RepID=M3IQN3_CANMX|nr:hypothetical protein G210_0587 [Candida maltosa Xu316]
MVDSPNGKKIVKCFRSNDGGFKIYVPRDMVMEFSDFPDPTHSHFDEELDDDSSDSESEIETASSEDEDEDANEIEEGDNNVAPRPSNNYHGRRCAGRRGQNWRRFPRPPFVGGHGRGHRNCGWNRKSGFHPPPPPPPPSFSFAFPSVPHPPHRTDRPHHPMHRGPVASPRGPYNRKHWKFDGRDGSDSHCYNFHF